MDFFFPWKAVLLGEGYYADRTTKQTIEILKRRATVLDSQADSFKAMMKDLQAEASFFDTTACEVAEGLLEMREEYMEEKTSGRTSESGDLQMEDEDEEYAHIMSKLDELEQEELAAEIENWTGENKQNSAAESDNEDGEVEEAKIVFDQFSDLNSPDHNLGHSEDFELSKLQQKKEKITFDEFANNYNHQQVQAVSRDAQSDGKSMANSAKAAAAAAAVKALILSEVKENVAVASLSRKEMPAQTSKLGFDSHKAFTGSMVEHPYNIQTNPQEQSGSSSKPFLSQPLKPVSRFKMQRK